MLLNSLRKSARIAGVGVPGQRLTRFFSSNHMDRLHVPFNPETTEKMLNSVECKSEERLIKDVLGDELARVESIKHQYMKEIPLLKQLIEAKMRGAKQDFSYIGQGFYNTSVPAIVERCVLTNPMWYTAYTPYQAEISQGRLEALFNYQIMIKRITKMEVANACMLDEASAAAEAALMAFRVHNGARKTLLVLNSVGANTRAVIESTSNEVGIKVKVVDKVTEELITENKDSLIGVVFQTPDMYGFLHDYTEVIQKVQAVGGMAIVGTDILSCVINKTPGEMGADVAYGNGQRFGTPMGYGGPHAAFFATKMTHLRRMPGRIISCTKDVHNNTAFRLAVQTREQHIRREIATSNICTSQVLLANMNFFYALYHGEEGLVSLANSIQSTTIEVAQVLKSSGVKLLESTIPNEVNFFDTLTIKVPDADDFAAALRASRISVYRIDNNHVSISIDETNRFTAPRKLVNAILKYLEKPRVKMPNDFEPVMAQHLMRGAKPIFKPEDIFSKIKGEHELLRYITRLARKDITLCDSMIPLGSCTMKLNAAFEMQMYGHPALNIHPYVIGGATKGYKVILKELSQMLCHLTGMDGVTYQSNSGSMGEYVGLKVMRRYLESIGQGHRNIVLIPASAHGTNPASAAKMGLKVVVVGVDSNGYINQEDFVQKLKEHKESLFGLMLTFPSTHGVFEENTKALIEMVHRNGGQVYIDGANMNAQLGLTSPGFINGDVCHLNLHKTFSIPHGGGGPGMGPVLVKSHLLEFLPSHKELAICAYNSAGELIPSKGPQTLSSPFGSASILMISYVYIKSMSMRGMRRCGTQAILSANYLARKLSPYYKVLYTNKKGMVAHEFILDIRPIKAETGVTEEDIAKRLMDYNFHAPTMSFPVAGTLMVEPTESENLEELDRFAEAMIQIHAEIQDVKTGKLDKLDNPLKNAPHTLAHVASDTWTHKYSREVAGFPLSWLRTRGKVWPSVGRINNAQAERNLMFELPSQSEGDGLKQ